MTEKVAYCFVCDICGTHSFGINRYNAKKGCCEKIGKRKHQHSIGDVVKINRLVKIGPGSWDNRQMDINIQITELHWEQISHKPYYSAKQLTGLLVNTGRHIFVFDEKEIID